MVRYRKNLQHRNLAALALAQIVGIQLIIARFYWSPGYSYGPRYFTDAIPWFVLLAILGLDAMRKAHDAIGDAQRAIQDAPPHRIEIAAASFLIAVNVAVNAPCVVLYGSGLE